MIAIIDYEAGNLLSVERAVRKSGFDCKITMDKGEVLRAEKVSINSAAVRNPSSSPKGQGHSAASASFWESMQSGYLDQFFYG